MACGVFVAKADKHQDVSCIMRGREIKARYDEIRSLGCKRCGRVPVEPQGCQVKIDYVTNCW